MPLFQTSQEWLQQSTLLFQAYPTTSRVTTKYKIHPAQPSSPRKRKRPTDSNNAASQPEPSTAEPAAQTPNPAAPKATLTLKTFDPVSGVCLKYRTDKGAEVGRLIASLGKLGKHMAARPDADEDVPEAGTGGAGPGESAGKEEEGAATAEAAASQPKPSGAGAGGGGGGGGGGGKKKKKGKK